MSDFIPLSVSRLFFILGLEAFGVGTMAKIEFDANLQDSLTCPSLFRRVSEQVLGFYS